MEHVIASLYMPVEKKKILMTEASCKIAVHIPALSEFHGEPPRVNKGACATKGPMVDPGGSGGPHPFTENRPE